MRIRCDNCNEVFCVSEDTKISDDIVCPKCVKTYNIYKGYIARAWDVAISQFEKRQTISTGQAKR